MTIVRIRHLIVVTLCVLALYGCEKAAPPAEDSVSEPAVEVNAIADRYYAFMLDRTPEVAYFSGVELDRHDGIQDNSPEARQADETVIDDLLQRLESIGVDSLDGRTEWITHAYLLQQLKASVAQRICRTELWNVNQMSGWQLVYSQIAQLQPTGSPEYREQSIARWSKLAGYFDQEIENLRLGLELGYSAPQSVVQRVIDQVEGLLALEIEKSPFYSPATRDDDEAFAAATRQVVASQIYPALQRFRDFLSDIYFGRAREELSVTANPNGLECYEASLRAYTTLDRSGKEVYELGQETVAANKARVIELGRAAYELDDFNAIIDMARNDPADRFANKDQLFEFSRDAVERAESEMSKWVGRMPTQEVDVVPFPEHDEGTGRSAHYLPGSAWRIQNPAVSTGSRVTW